MCSFRYTKLLFTIYIKIDFNLKKIKQSFISDKHKLYHREQKLLFVIKTTIILICMIKIEIKRNFQIEQKFYKHNLVSNSLIFK